MQASLPGQAERICGAGNTALSGPKEILGNPDAGPIGIPQMPQGMLDAPNEVVLMPGAESAAAVCVALLN